VLSPRASVRQRSPDPTPARAHPHRPQALGAEIVVNFTGTNDLGGEFMARNSYLTSEIHWGCVFVNVIKRADAGKTQHTVDLARCAC
jgi:hypothetical protein